MSIFILDLVSRVEANATIGACLSNYLTVAGLTHYHAPVGSRDEFLDAFTHERHPQPHLNAILLIAHSNPQGFQFPNRNRTLFRWEAFGRLLAEFLPHKNLLFLCGCETGTEETLRSMMTAAPTLRTIYGVRERIAYPQATYGFLSLFYHAGVRRRAAS